MALTLVLAKGTRCRIDQRELEMLERRLQLSGNLEYEAEPQVYFVGSTVYRVNVQQLLERLRSPVELPKKERFSYCQGKRKNGGK